MHYILIAILAGHTYTATPARYATLEACERAAWVMRVTAIRARYECRAS